MGKKIFYHLFKANVIKQKLNVFKRVIISLIIIIFVSTILNNINHLYLIIYPKLI